MKKISFLTMLFLTPFSLLAAQQLTQQQAEQIKPFKEISVRGLYYSILEYQRVISNMADRAGADAYYIKDVQLFPANDRMRIITADLYMNNAEKVETKSSNEKTYPLQDGIYEYDQAYYQTHEHSKIVHVNGYFPTRIILKKQVIKKAKEEGAAGFYIYRIVDAGSNENVTVVLFDKDARKIAIQMKYDDIPLDSKQSTQTRAEIVKQNKMNEHAKINQMNQQALGQTAQATINPIQSQEKKTSIDQVNDSKNTITPPTNVKPSVETNNSNLKIIEPERYTVTSKSGEKIQELNNATALKMIPFKTIKFRGYFGTPTAISKIAAQKAAEHNAKFFHIAHVTFDVGNGRNQTVYVELYN